jgi:hypothetical protein
LFIKKQLNNLFNKKIKKTHKFFFNEAFLFLLSSLNYAKIFIEGTKSDFSLLSTYIGAVFRIAFFFWSRRITLYRMAYPLDKREKLAPPPSPPQIFLALVSGGSYFLPHRCPTEIMRAASPC